MAGALQMLETGADFRFSRIFDGAGSQQLQTGPIPKSGRSWHLRQSEKARFSGKSGCIALYAGCGSYQSYSKPLV
jgi:hypothetical protein